MEFRVKYCIGPLLLLFTWTLCAENTSFKAEFGKEFSIALKKYHAELLQSNMDRYDELINSLLRDTKPSPADERRFKSHLETIKEIKDQIGDSVDIPLIKKLKDFGKRIVLDLLFYRLSYIDNGEAGKVVQDILDRGAEYEKKDAKAFKQKMYNKYHEMYKQIPAEELEKHDEYTFIDKLMERVANRSIEEAGTVESLLEYISVFAKLGDFLEIPEYKELF